MGKEQERGRAARRGEREAAEKEVGGLERRAAETERAAEGLEAAAATAHKFLSQVSIIGGVLLNGFANIGPTLSQWIGNRIRVDIFPTGEENEDVVGGVLPGDGRGHGAGGQGTGRTREKIQVWFQLPSFLAMN